MELFRLCCIGIILLLSLFSCERIDSLEEAADWFRAHKADLVEMNGVIERHPELKRIDPQQDPDSALWLAERFYGAATENTSAAYKALVGMMKVAGVTLISVERTGPNNGPHFDVIMYQIDRWGLAGSSEGMYKAFFWPASECQAVEADHWWVCHSKWQ